MPIYEYRCTRCGTQKEHLLKMSADPLTTCPACGDETYVKQVSAAGFQLKGTGWYATDFKNSGSAPAPKQSEKTEAKTSDAPAAGGAAACGGGGCGCH